MNMIKCTKGQDEVGDEIVSTKVVPVIKVENITSPERLEVETKHIALKKRENALCKLDQTNYIEREKPVLSELPNENETPLAYPAQQNRKVSVHFEDAAIIKHAKSLPQSPWPKKRNLSDDDSETEYGGAETDEYKGDGSPKRLSDVLIQIKDIPRDSSDQNENETSAFGNTSNNSSETSRTNCSANAGAIETTAEPETQKIRNIHKGEIILSCDGTQAKSVNRATIGVVLQFDQIESGGMLTIEIRKLHGFVTPGKQMFLYFKAKLLENEDSKTRIKGKSQLNEIKRGMEEWHTRNRISIKHVQENLLLKGFLKIAACMVRPFTTGKTVACIIVNMETATRKIGGETTSLGNWLLGNTGAPIAVKLNMTE